jgi:hypothetical protein
VSADKIVLAGYLVRCPLGGYAWQVLHYLVGLRALGFDPYFYEDTAYYADCFDPASGNMHVRPDAGVAFAADFFARFGLADHWMFWDAAQDCYHGCSGEQTAAVLRDARVVLTLAAVTHLPRQPGQQKVFIDIDPGFTQLRVAAGEAGLCDLLAEHDRHFTIGENIGTPPCPIPTARFEWLPTRQPIATELWRPLPEDPAAAYTTVGRWDEQRRDVRFHGEIYGWRKRVEWMKFLDLPARTGQRFAPAMDVDKTPDDAALLRRHGWELTDPIAVSRDALVYRDFIRGSKGEFTVAKDLNVRLSTGWFSDRAACYLAAGRPVITQDTGFGSVLPVGRGLFAVRNVEDAVAAVATVEADYPAHAQAARGIAAAHFDAHRVLADLIRRL